MALSTYQLCKLVDKPCPYPLTFEGQKYLSKIVHETNQYQTLTVTQNGTIMQKRLSFQMFWRSIFRFTRDCYLEVDGEVTCRNCPPEFTGRRCERCAPGYVGNPQVIGDTCRPEGQGRCDPRGSYSPEPNPRTGRCDCKVRTRKRKSSHVSLIHT